MPLYSPPPDPIFTGPRPHPLCTRTPSPAPTPTFNLNLNVKEALPRICSNKSFMDNVMMLHMRVVHRKERLLADPCGAMDDLPPPNPHPPSSSSSIFFLISCKCDSILPTCPMVRALMATIWQYMGILLRTDRQTDMTENISFPQLRYRWY